MNPSRPLDPRLLPVLLLLVFLALLANTFADGAWQNGSAPFPFACRDVALVHTLCTLPLAMMIGTWFPRGTSALILGGFLLGLACLPMLGLIRATLLPLILASTYHGLLVRACFSFALIHAFVLIVRELISPRPIVNPSGRERAILITLGLVFLFLPPFLFVGARTRHHLARLDDFLEQARYGEAHLLAHQLVLLDAPRDWKGQSLRQWALGLAHLVEELERKVAYPLPSQATPALRLDRARHLAMLGRTEEALKTLAEMGQGAEVEGLRATIQESREEWSLALDSHAKADARWKARADSVEKRTGLVRAATGRAYCLRKLGYYPQAREAYQEVLALSPTADTHFLLAQFHEDAQDAAQAHFHANRAREMDPVRYESAASRLINQLQVHHFGCLKVYDAESRR